MWEELPGGQGELEFLVDGDAAMLVDLPIDMITGLLFGLPSCRYSAGCCCAGGGVDPHFCRPGGSDGTTGPAELQRPDC